MNSILIAAEDLQCCVYVVVAATASSRVPLRIRRLVQCYRNRLVYEALQEFFSIRHQYMYVISVAQFSFELICLAMALFYAL